MAAEPRLTCLGFCGADDSVDPRLLAAVSEVRHMLGGCMAALVPWRSLPLSWMMENLCAMR